MADIKQVLGKPVEYEIEGVKVTLKPLVVANIDLLLKMQDDNSKGGAIKEILEIYLKQAFPEASEEDLSQVSFGFVTGLLEKAMAVNGLSE